MLKLYSLVHRGERLRVIKARAVVEFHSVRVQQVYISHDGDTEENSNLYVGLKATDQLRNSVMVRGHGLINYKDKKKKILLY